MAALSPVAIVSTTLQLYKRTEMTRTHHVVTLKHQFLHHVTIKRVLVIFHYQNIFQTFCTSVIWWRHLPAASYNFFSACVSGNRQQLCCQAECKTPIFSKRGFLQTKSNNVVKWDLSPKACKGMGRHI
jgi:hypothetical protein